MVWNPDDPEGWSTTKTTEFVSAYAHGKNPDEDFAESGILFLSLIQINSVQGHCQNMNLFAITLIRRSIYISRIREDLTFEVLNLYPDYDYPGKIKSVSTKVRVVRRKTRKLPFV